MSMNNHIPAPLDDTHIFRMTDCTGMFQHARYGVPDPSEGYTSDDNARALIMAVMFYEASGNKKYLDLAFRYLSFLYYAESDGWFRNFMDYDRRFSEKKGSPDCFGRCVFSLGFTTSRSALPESMRSAAKYLLTKVLPCCRSLAFPRSKAYAAIGLGLWDNEAARGALKNIAADLAAAYERSSSEDWQWFEPDITYCNAVLPGAMFAAYESSLGKKYLEIGTICLDFLLKCTFKDDIFSPVGCNGWLKQGQSAAEFDQQPVEACCTLLACRKAYELTGRQFYADRMRGCLLWFTGKNAAGKSLIDTDTGGCMDGITPRGCNGNEGAESLISWIISSLALQNEDTASASDM